MKKCENFCERPVTLQELLDSRERRAARQKALLAAYGGEDGVLLSVTLNIPGPVKDRPAYRRALEEGAGRLRRLLPAEAVIHEELHGLPTGPEGYLCLDGRLVQPLQAKKLAVQIEEADGLGRLLDIDVLTAEGGISRSALGLSGRRCLLCGEDAKVCARSQRHPLEELLAEIGRILEE